ncbi:IclR family transcriptional regulator [Micromonospora fluostatini]|uniref:IclR family transcriptional regulator n=1 Tax=Micromonospora sp. JCM 30529 TaxID=3421643 RepID=UPI003D166C81
MGDRNVGDTGTGTPGNIAKNLLARSLSVIEFLGASAAPPRFSSIARATSIPKSTLHRLLTALTDAEMVVRLGDAYRLGQRLDALRRAGDDPLPDPLRHVLLPHLVRLHYRTGLVTYLGVLDLDALVVCETAYTVGQEGLAPGRGGRLPAHCTAAGKLLVAYDSRLVEQYASRPHLPGCTRFSIGDGRHLQDELARIRHAGTADADQEWRLGLREAAAPVFGVAARPLAGLALLWPHDTPDPGPDVLSALRRAAFAASLALRRALADGAASTAG